MFWINNMVSICFAWATLSGETSASGIKQYKYHEKNMTRLTVSQEHD